MTLCGSQDQHLNNSISCNSFLGIKPKFGVFCQVGTSSCLVCTIPSLCEGVSIRKKGRKEVMGQDERSNEEE